jgi:hypothetical protein
VLLLFLFLLQPLLPLPLLIGLCHHCHCSCQIALERFITLGLQPLVLLLAQAPTFRGTATWKSRSKGQIVKVFPCRGNAAKAGNRTKVQRGCEQTAALQKRVKLQEV